MLTVSFENECLDVSRNWNRLPWFSWQLLGFITVVLNRFKQLILICIPNSRCSPKLKNPNTCVQKQWSFYQFLHENHRFLEVSEIIEMGYFLFFFSFQKSQNLWFFDSEIFRIWEWWSLTKSNTCPTLIRTCHKGAEVLSNEPPVCFIYPLFLVGKNSPKCEIQNFKMKWY